VIGDPSIVIEDFTRFFMGNGQLNQNQRENGLVK
jgi:hypothetical protein